MDQIDAGAGPHIKEDSVTTIIIIEDAITGIIALLVLIWLRALGLGRPRRGREREWDL